MFSFDYRICIPYVLKKLLEHATFSQAIIALVSSSQSLVLDVTKLLDEGWLPNLKYQLQTKP
jgi:hypothetical protein